LKGYLFNSKKVCNFKVLKIIHNIAFFKKSHIMPNLKITMLKLKRMLQMLAAGLSFKLICKDLHMSKRTLSTYKQAAVSTGRPLIELSRLDDDQLSALLFPATCVYEADSRQGVLASLKDYYLGELNRPHVTVQLLWEEYIAKHPDGYKYTQFKKHILDYKKSREYSYHNVYSPGYEWQIDFAGDKLYLTDSKLNVITAVVLLCCTLPYSDLSFAIALPDAKMEHLFYGLSRALEYIGGVPHTVKADNMKQWVKKVSRYEPLLTESTGQWCLHYNTQPITARVGRPRDKGAVEGFVSRLYQFIYARIRDEVFGELDSLNNRIYGLIDEFNSRDMKQKGVSRFDVFYNEEQAHLQPLPGEPYRFRYRKEFSVSSSYHVSVGSEKNSYSIPHEYVSRPARVVWDMETVEIYVSDKRVAIHPRRFNKNGYTTLDEHMPPAHLAYKRRREYNAAAIRKRASLIGTKTVEAIDRILSSRNYPQQSYNSCHGVFSLAAKYGENRMEAACEYILSKTDSISYAMLRNVLERQIDRAAIEGSNQVLSTLPHNEDVRGADEYANL
jgi:transposase